MAIPSENSIKELLETPKGVHASIHEEIKSTLEKFLLQSLSESTIESVKYQLENIAIRVADTLQINVKPDFKVTDGLDRNSITFHPMNTFSLYVCNSLTTEYDRLQDIAIEKESGRLLKCIHGTVHYKDSQDERWKVL